MELAHPLIFPLIKQSNAYHIRITTDNVDLKKSYQAFQAYNYLIISNEGSTEETRKHQHIFIAHPDITKEQIRSIILDLYPEAKGNKGHSIKLARKTIELISYVLKEGGYMYKGFTQQFIADAKKLSYKKDGFKKEYKQLTNELQLNQISLRTYTRRLLDLKAQYNQPIYLNHIKSHILTMGIKTGDFNATDLTDQLFSQLQ